MRKGNRVSMLVFEIITIRTILARHWTVKLGRQTADCNKSFQSLVSVLTQLHFGQWSSLPFCLPSLIVARQDFSFLTTGHDYEIGVLLMHTYACSFFICLVNEIKFMLISKHHLRLRFYAQSIPIKLIRYIPFFIRSTTFKLKI